MVTDRFFYPHTLQHKNSDGSWQNLYGCRDQPNHDGKTIDIADRTDYLYKSLVFIPKTLRVFKFGESVRILGENGELRIDGTVSRFSIDGIEDNRIWI